MNTTREVLVQANIAIKQVLARIEVESDPVLCVVEGLLKASTLSVDAALDFDLSSLDDELRNVL